jgi:hypothetical protein
MVQIRCPSDCVWLASAREHPAAKVVRQQQRDVAFAVQLMRDFSERQAQLFLLLSSFLVRYDPQEFQTLIDDDLVEATNALAATFETASRGVIYEHRPPSLSGERLMAALKALLAETGRGLGSTFERDAAAVLRRVAEAASEMRGVEPANRRGFLDLLGRVVVKNDAAEAGSQTAAPASAAPSGLIVP